VSITFRRGRGSADLERYRIVSSRDFETPDKEAPVLRVS